MSFPFVILHDRLSRKPTLFKSFTGLSVKQFDGIYKVIESKMIKENDEEICFVRMEKNKIQYYSYWWYEFDNKKYTSLTQVLLLKLFYNKSVRLINETSSVN